MNPTPDSIPGLSWRSFLGRSGALLGGALLARATGTARAAEGRILISDRPDAPYDFSDPATCLYSTCLNCNTSCGIKVKVQDGVVTKIDGNPYNPWALFPHLPGSASPFDAVYVDGSICPKGQAGLQTAYDPYRIRKVLKRAGRRGEGRGVTIEFDQAIKEIVEDGKLFAHVPGEANRQVEGLRSLMALRDPKVAKAMAADVDAIWKEKDPAKKAALVELFKQKHAAHLGVLVDPDHPDFGPRNNQFTIAWGRLKGGRSEFTNGSARPSVRPTSMATRPSARARGTSPARPSANSIKPAPSGAATSSTGRPTPRTPASSSLWGPTCSRPITARPTAPCASPTGLFRARPASRWWTPVSPSSPARPESGCPSTRVRTAPWPWRSYAG